MLNQESFKKNNTTIPIRLYHLIISIKEGPNCLISLSIDIYAFWISNFSSFLTDKMCSIGPFLNGIELSFFSLFSIRSSRASPVVYLGHQSLWSFFFFILSRYVFLYKPRELAHFSDLIDIYLRSFAACKLIIYTLKTN